MSSMDFNVGIEDVGIVVLQELWNRVAIQAVNLVSDTGDLVLRKGSFQEFSRSMSGLSTLLRALDTKKVEAAIGLESTKTTLETLNDQLKEARKIIKDYKSGSRLRLLLRSNSMLLRMKSLAREIATTISSFQLVKLEMALNLKTMTNQIVDSLRSMEFQAAVANESIASEIEKSMLQNDRNRQNAVKLLAKIADAVGVSTNASLVQSELELLKQEKEELEAEQKQAEALQLTQLIQLLYSTELVTRPQDEEILTYVQQFPIEPLICPLCNELMADPVAIVCGHSFERKAIQEHFKQGRKDCPTCRQELSYLDLIPNHSLRSSIEEWKQRDTYLRFQAAVTNINSNDHSGQNRALEDLQNLMEMPQYAEKVAKEGLIPKLVDFLKDTRLNAKATLKCLNCLAINSDDHSEAIIEAGAVRCIVKLICKGEAKSEAIAVLLELSKKETLVQKIGKTKDCIPVMVSLLDNSNPNVSQKARDVLQNLSSNTHFAVKMAEAGYFQPFVACFNQGSQETRALMAAALINMLLKENSIKILKDRQFIHNIIQMLSTNSPACKSACLKCLKKLIAYPKMVKRLLSDLATIPLLLGLITFRSDSQLKQDAAENLALMVAACHHDQFQLYQGLQELQSEHNVNLFLQLAANSEHQIKIQFLHLLVELSYKSEKARNLIRSNNDAITQLFSSLDGEKPVVRRWTMKLIHSISEGNADAVPLPPSPRKETAVNNLALIFACSPDIEERSIAAGIISQLPKDDNGVDELLRKSEALKAIHEVISSMDREHDGIRTPFCKDTQGTSLLENALAALLRFTDPTKPELQKQVGKLDVYPSLIRLLSTGSSIAKQRTAIALAQLSLSTSRSVSNATIMENQTSRLMPTLLWMKLFPNMSWCCSASPGNHNFCSLHGSACSPRETFCLVKADAVKPLVRTLNDMESGAAEAALTALNTLVVDQNTLSHATSVIVDSQGLMAILQVLEKGSFSAKTKALDLFQKILTHARISDPLLLKRCENILIQLLHDEALKKKVAMVLVQLNIIPYQSSYF